MAEQIFETIHACRACGYDKLVDILDLGMQPLANSLVKHKGDLPRNFP